MSKAKEVAALRLRLADMAQGRLGHNEVDDPDGAGLAYEMGIEEWLDFVAAVKKTWCPNFGGSLQPGFVSPQCFELWNLYHLAETLDSVAAWLYEQGARADAGGGS